MLSIKTTVKGKINQHRLDYCYGVNMKKIFMGVICGLLNGLFGSGGGVAAVPMLEAAKLEAKESHATSVALIFVLSLATTISYFLGDKLDFTMAWSYIPYGLVGAIAGAVLLKKIPNSLLRRIFGVIILFAAFRILVKQ
ncbi:MAG: sulfite exporter TauE/SafE family protein [Ruminococcaceae bacterium]|nr:sulfite exporter TauE/SafE family protein [Oscillospiraceae bacterium]